MQEILQKGWHIKNAKCRSLQSNVWEIIVPGQKYILKKSKLKPEHLKFICAAEELLQNRRFPYFAPLHKTVKGELLYENSRGNYTLHRALPGEKCDFEDIKQLRLTAATLGALHNHNNGLTAEGQRRSVLPDYIRQLTQRTEQLQAMAKTAAEHRDEFGQLYLQGYPLCLSRAMASVEHLEHSPYRDLYRLSEKAGHFIHGDIAARNVIINGDTAYLIDFDYCRRDLPIIDLARLLRRSITAHSDSEASLGAIFGGYCQNRPLLKGEYAVLKALLLFPQRFWRTAYRYYYGRDNGIPLPPAEKLAEAIAESERMALLQKELSNREEVFDYV